MRYARLLVAKLVLFAITPVMAQAVSSQTFAVSWFTTPEGSTGIVSVIRQGNPVTTQLFYSTCVDTDQPVCQEGTGNIPNASFTGNVSTSLTRANVMSLLVDTTAPGFQNWLCIAPDYDLATCDGGTAPATGGVIQASWTKGQQWARITTAADKLYNFGRVIQGSTSGTYAYYATMRGSFLGTTMNTTGIITGEIMLQTGSVTPGSAVETLASKFAKGRLAIPRKVTAR